MGKQIDPNRIRNSPWFDQERKLARTLTEPKYCDGRAIIRPILFTNWNAVERILWDGDRFGGQGEINPAKNIKWDRKVTAVRRNFWSSISSGTDWVGNDGCGITINHWRKDGVAGKGRLERQGIRRSLHFTSSKPLEKFQKPRVGTERESRRSLAVSRLPDFKSSESQIVPERAIADQALRKKTVAFGALPPECPI